MELIVRIIALTAAACVLVFIGVAITEENEARPTRSKVAACFLLFVAFVACLARIIYIAW